MDEHIMLHSTHTQHTYGQRLRTQHAHSGANREAAVADPLAAARAYKYFCHSANID